MNTAKNWDEVENILFEGKAEEIMALRCPDCGSVLSYRYFDGAEGMRSGLDIRCDCQYCSLDGLYRVPSCVEYFGEKARIDENLKLKKSA